MIVDPVKLCSVCMYRSFARSSLQHTYMYILSVYYRLGGHKQNGLRSEQRQWLNRPAADGHRRSRAELRQVLNFRQLDSTGGEMKASGQLSTVGGYSRIFLSLAFRLKHFNIKLTFCAVLRLDFVAVSKSNEAFFVLEITCLMA